MRARAIVLGGASLALALLVPAVARAQLPTAIVERVRVQGGYSTQQNPAPTPRLNDWFASAIPGVTLFWFERNATYSLDESVNGTYHFVDGTTEIANYTTLQAAIELSQRTELLLSATGAYSTVSQYLILNQAPLSGVGLLPGQTTKIVSARVSEQLKHQLTDRFSLSQGADAGVFTTLAPAQPLDSFTSSVSLGALYAWERDGLGGDARAAYGETLTVPPQLDQHFMTFNVGPTWRHDWNDQVTSSANAGLSAAYSIDTGKSILGPSALASVTYTGDPTVVSATYQTGFYPNLLSGQLTRSHTGAVHVLFPISLEHQIIAGSSVGFGHSDLLDLQNRANDQAFNVILSDFDVTWQATPLIQPFARYQFTGQLGDVNAVGFNPSYLRDIFLVGVQITSKPPGVNRGGAGGESVPSSFPQRVDGKDVPGGANTEGGATVDVSRVPGQVDDGVSRPDQGAGPPAPPPPNQNDTGGSRWIYTRPRPPQPEKKLQWGPQ